jgi:hypothetical protein
LVCIHWKILATGFHLQRQVIKLRGSPGANAIKRFTAVSYESS